MRHQKEGLKGKGFTLIELTVVMVIVGIIISIMAAVLPSLIQSGKIRKARVILESIDYSLQGYITANGKLPYADTDSDGQGDAGAYFGRLPYRDLGLSSGNDVWGNQIKYGVYSDLTATTTGTFCSTLSAASTATFDTSKLYITREDTTQTNIACVIVSGGQKDRDGANGFFDGLNGDDNAEYDDPERIITTSYDDLMTVASFTTVIGRHCTGGGGGSGGGGGGGGVENGYTNGCTNGVDDDGDGYVDCDDPDCAGDPVCSGGGASVTIVTTSIPAGSINGDYTTTFSATGGIIPYKWSLTDNGGFSDFYLHPYTAKLTGTFDKCPGTYTISVNVEDSTLPADGGPTTDSASFDLQLTSNLSVARTSGAGVDITWSSSGQEETFKANGGRLGDINWSLDPGGATGFTVTSTGSDTCVLKKNGTSTAGTYNFTVTATDAICPGNTADILLVVTVLSSGTGYAGAIIGVIDSLEFDTSSGFTPDIVHVSGNIYAITYRGGGGDGFIKSVEIATDGQITNAVVDTLEFDNQDGRDPEIIHVSGDVFAVTYRGRDGDGFIRTVQIAAEGQMSTSTIDSLEYDNRDGNYPSIIHISGNVYAVAYQGNGSDGFVRTVQVAANGQMPASTIDSLEFDTSNGREPDIVHVAGDIFAIAYRGPGDDGFVKTVQIAADGTITNSVIATLEYDTQNGLQPDIINTSGDVFAIVYRGDNDDGYLATITIAADGQIGAAVIDTFEYDADEGCEPNIIPIADSVFAIAYRGDNDDGFVKTVDISVTGEITEPAIDTLEFDTNRGYEPKLIHIAGDVFAVVYRGEGDDGYLKTIEIKQ